MMINDKARGRRGEKDSSRAGWLLLLADPQSSGPYSNEVVYRRINVSAGLMRVLCWPEGALGDECFAIRQMDDMIQTHTWHVRYRVCLINLPLFLPASSECQYVFWSRGGSNLSFPSYFHTFWSCKSKRMLKIYSLSSVFTEHVSSLLTSFFSMTSTARRPERMPKKQQQLSDKNTTHWLKPSASGGKPNKGKLAASTGINKASRNSCFFYYTSPPNPAHQFDFL